MKENTITYSLAKEIKLESDQVSGCSCPFPGKTEQRHIFDYARDAISKIQTMGNSSRQMPQLTYNEKERMERTLTDSN